MERGLPVLALDCAKGPEAEAIAMRARSLGYAPYVTPDAAFSSLSVNRPTR